MPRINTSVNKTKFTLSWVSHNSIQREKMMQVIVKKKKLGFDDENIKWRTNDQPEYTTA